MSCLVERIDQIKEMARLRFAHVDSTGGGVTRLILPDLVVSLLVEAGVFVGLFRTPEP